MKHIFFLWKLYPPLPRFQRLNSENKAKTQKDVVYEWCKMALTPAPKKIW